LKVATTFTLQKCPHMEEKQIYKRRERKIMNLFIMTGLLKSKLANEEQLFICGIFLR